MAVSMLFMIICGGKIRIFTENHIKPQMLI